MTQTRTAWTPADTHPDAWRAHIDARRKMSPQERLDEWAALNLAGIRMQEASVRRRHPDYDAEQVFLAMVRGRYGAELAAKVWPKSSEVTP